MRVFVFGAGASAPAGFPLGKDMMRVVKEWLPYEEYKPLWRELHRLRIFRKSDDLELNLTRLDLEIEGAIGRREQAGVVLPRWRWLWPAWRGPVPKGRRRREYLLGSFRDWGLTEAIRRPLVKSFDEALSTPGRLDYLRKFVKRHVRPGDCIITFNYDCLLEAILREERLWNLGDGYGVDIRLTYPDIGNQENSPCTVLKLHGSVGWFFAVMENLLLIDQATYSRLTDKTEIRTSLSRNQGVKEGAILPTYLKGFERFPMPVIWRKAQEAVASAERIAIIGYSFPRADSAARMLFLTNARPGRPLFYYVYEVSARARELKPYFEGVGLELLDMKACIQHLANVETLWPQRPDANYCGHRSHRPA